MRDDGIRYHSGNPLLIDLTIAADVDTVAQVRSAVVTIMETLSAIGADVPVIRDHPPVVWQADRDLYDIVTADPLVSERVIRMVVADRHADVVYALRVMLMWLGTRPS